MLLTKLSIKTFLTQTHMRDWPGGKLHLWASDNNKTSPGISFQTETSLHIKASSFSANTEMQSQS